MQTTLKKRVVRLKWIRTKAEEDREIYERLKKESKNQVKGIRRKWGNRKFNENDRRRNHTKELFKKINEGKRAIESTRTNTGIGRRDVKNRSDSFILIYRHLENILVDLPSLTLVYRPIKKKKIFCSLFENGIT